MSFLVSTCITVGASGLGSTLKLYLNPISSTNFGTYLQSVSKTDITGANCPYTFEVPDGTTSIRVYDQTNYCYVDFNVEDSNSCNVCNLNFDNISNNLIGTINVGNLTGSCDPSITDYKVSWYGPNSSTNVAFTSGKGTAFPGYTSPHPLTGSSAPLLFPGVYESRITDVELNGVKFSVTGGTGTGFVLSSGLTACSMSFNVSAFTCNNGTYEGPYYEHQKTFLTDGTGTIPQALSTVFELSAGTEFFIYQLTGYIKYDTLKITYSGASSPVPLVLENIKVGTNPSPGTDIYFTSAERDWASQSMKRILPLSGISINSGDILIMEITPYNGATDTSWDLKFGCYSNPTLNKTCFDTYKDESYKIVKSTINTVDYGSCNGTGVTFNITGCTLADKNNLDNSPLGQYGVNGSPFGDNQSYGPLTYNTYAFYNSNISQSRYQYGCTNYGCVSTVGNTITITKTISNFDFFFESSVDCSAYYNSYISAYNGVTSSLSSTPYSSDPTNIGYYRALKIILPNSSCSQTSVCDTCSSITNHYLDVTANVSTGTTTGGYYMTISLPTMSNSYTCLPCENGCPSSVTQIVNDVNNSATGTTFTTRTYNNGLRQDSPFCYDAVLTTNSGSRTEVDTEGYIYTYGDYFNKLIPQSGFTNTLTPQYSAITIDWKNHFYLSFPSIDDGGFTFYRQTFFKFKVSATTVSPLTFKIYAKDVVDWGKDIDNNTLFPWIEVYDSTNPSASDPNFVT